MNTRRRKSRVSYNDDPDSDDDRIESSTGPPFVRDQFVWFHVSNVDGWWPAQYICESVDRPTNPETIEIKNEFAKKRAALDKSKQSKAEAPQKYVDKSKEQVTNGREQGEWKDSNPDEAPRHWFGSVNVRSSNWTPNDHKPDEEAVRVHREKAKKHWIRFRDEWIHKPGKKDRSKPGNSSKKPAPSPSLSRETIAYLDVVGVTDLTRLRPYTFSGKRELIVVRLRNQTCDISYGKCSENVFLSRITRG